MPRVFPYRLYNEDCFETFRRIPDGSVDLVLCDPPYGTTQCKWDSIIPLEPMWRELRRVAKPSAAVSLFCAQPFSSVLIGSSLNNFKYCWTWRKNKGLGFLNSKKMPLRDTEDIAVFYSKQPTYNPQMRTGEPYSRPNSPSAQKGTNGSYSQIKTESSGERFPLTTLYYPKVEKAVHPTQKPVALMEYLIKTYSNEGDTVLDFAMGSGTTGVACGNLRRKFIGCDNDKEHGYFAIARERIEKAYRESNNANVS